MFLKALNAIDWRYSLEDFMLVARQASPTNVLEAVVEEKVLKGVFQLLERIRVTFLPRLRRFEIELRAGNSEKYNRLKKMEQRCRSLRNESNEYTASFMQDSKQMVALIAEHERQNSAVMSHEASRSLFLEAEKDARLHADRLRNNKLEADLSGSESEYCHAAIIAMEDQARKSSKHAEAHEKAMKAPMEEARRVKGRIGQLRDEMVRKNRELKDKSSTLNMCMMNFNRLRREAAYLARHLGTVEHLIEEWENQVESRANSLL